MPSARNPVTRVLTATAMVTASLLATGAVTAPSQAVRRPAADPAVVTTWNAIAARTIFAENATPIPSSSLYFGFVSIAVFDAVVAIEGGYQPYTGRLPRAHGNASAEAAAATAAYRVLSYYFPTSASNLAADYAASLDRVRNGAARDHGVRVGDAAAAALIDLRQDDGRGATVPQPGGTAPGQWRPTPDAFAPMLVPWLGFVRPLSLRSPTQVALPGPDPLTSPAYARDVAEVQAFGAKDGSSRTGSQTQTALFFNANAVLQYEEALRDRVTRHHLDLVSSARAFAVLGTSTADSLIACWRAKYDYAFWRPITAIRLADSDGNAATTPDPTWTPLVPTPPYGDYVSGHACITGAASGAISHLYGRDALDLQLFSSVTGTTRQYSSAEVLDTDTRNARIWLGLHFRRAMNDGNALGHQVSDWVAGHEFGPQH
jgi:hypothetical protein